jgi:hypothetical protein
MEAMIAGPSHCLTQLTRWSLGDRFPVADTPRSWGSGFPGSQQVSGRGRANAGQKNLVAKEDAPDNPTPHFSCAIFRPRCGSHSAMLLYDQVTKLRAFHACALKHNRGVGTDPGCVHGESESSAHSVANHSGKRKSFAYDQRIGTELRHSA